jgi:hypothetical protein
MARSQARAALLKPVSQPVDGNQNASKSSAEPVNDGASGTIAMADDVDTTPDNAKLADGENPAESVSATKKQMIDAADELIAAAKPGSQSTGKKTKSSSKSSKSSKKTVNKKASETIAIADDIDTNAGVDDVDSSPDNAKLADGEGPAERESATKKHMVEGAREVMAAAKPGSHSAGKKTKSSSKPSKSSKKTVNKKASGTIAIADDVVTNAGIDDVDSSPENAKLADGESPAERESGTKTQMSEAADEVIAAETPVSQSTGKKTKSSSKPSKSSKKTAKKKASGTIAIADDIDTNARIDDVNSSPDTAKLADGENPAERESATKTQMSEASDEVMAAEIPVSQSTGKKTKSSSKPSKSSKKTVKKGAAGTIAIADDIDTNAGINPAEHESATKTQMSEGADEVIAAETPVSQSTGKKTKSSSKPSKSSSKNVKKSATKTTNLTEEIATDEISETTHAQPVDASKPLSGSVGRKPKSSKASKESSKSSKEAKPPKESKESSKEAKPPKESKKISSKSKEKTSEKETKPKKSPSTTKKAEIGDSIKEISPAESTSSAVDKESKKKSDSEPKEKKKKIKKKLPEQ